MYFNELRIECLKVRIRACKLWCLNECSIENCMSAELTMNESINEWMWFLNGVSGFGGCNRLVKWLSLSFELNWISQVKNDQLTAVIMHAFGEVWCVHVIKGVDWADEIVLLMDALMNTTTEWTDWLYYIKWARLIEWAELKLMSKIKWARLNEHAWLNELNATIY